MNPHERVASLSRSLRTFINSSQHRRRRRRRTVTDEEVEKSTQCTHNPCIFSIFFVHIMAFKWKLKDFLLLRLESEFSAGLLWMKRKEGRRRSKRMLKIITGSSLLHTQYLLIFLKERFLWKLINHPCKCFLNELVNTMKLFFWHSLKFFSLKFFSSFTLKTLFFLWLQFSHH